MIITSDRVYFIKEDEARLLGPGHLEQLPNHPSSLKEKTHPVTDTTSISSARCFAACVRQRRPHLSHIFLDQFGADDSDKAGVRAVGHCASAQSLPCSRRPEQQHAFRRLDTQVHEPLRLHGRTGTSSERAEETDTPLFFFISGR